jgi:23S rRNA pseudouridine2605 synthase
MRLAKYLAHAGIASRRRAEALVSSGRVTVGGEVVTDPARDVDAASGVAVDGDPVGDAEERVVYVLHKPPGVVSTARDPGGHPTVVSLVDDPRRLYPVGRLDVDAGGLILLTNDGDLANRLTHPRYEVPKTYRVRVGSPPVREPTLRRLREGVELDDGLTAPAKVRRVNSDTLELTIHAGRNRQIKRMCEAVGHRVVALRRTRFGPLALGDLAPGASRQLSAAEIERLRKASRA